MKPTFSVLFLLLMLGVLVLAPGRARAQNCAQPPPAACGGVPFAVVDAVTGQEVQALCVGRAVRFVPCANRNVSSALVYYTALPGTNVYPPACLISPSGASTTYRYTPTAPGPVTVSENANTVLAGGGVLGTFYSRVLRAYATVPPPFTITPCPGGTALVTVIDTVYNNYTVQAGNGADVPIPRNQPQVVVLPVGATTITVTGRYNLVGPCQRPNTQPVPVLLPAKVPLLNRLTLTDPLPGGDAILTTDQLPAGYHYTLQRAPAGTAGPFQDVVDVPPGTGNLVVPKAAAGAYRLLRTDNCQTSTAVSALRYTLSLTLASARGRNQLLLADANPNPGPYAVTRDGSVIYSLVAVPGGLEDTAAVCGAYYRYRVTTDASAVVSNEVFIATNSKVPPPAPQLVASFSPQNQVVLTPTLAGSPRLAGGTLHYRRPPGGAGADFITTTTTRPVTDSTAGPNAALAAVCYSVRFADVCGNVSAESSPACPSILTARALDPDATSVALSWSAFAGPDPRQPATYALQTLAADGTVLATAPATTALSATDAQPPADRQILRYRLRIGGAGLPAGTFSYSNVAPLPRRTRVMIPNAFTPNGDGLNDVFEVKGRFLQNFVLVVVDRNGQQVFRATDRATTWDGSINGHPPVNGVYVWRFEQTDETGQSVQQTGTVTLLK